MTMTPTQFAQTLASYVAIVETNGTIQAVIDADPLEIGWELVEHHEREHRPFGDDLDEDPDLRRLLNAGRLVQDLLQQATRRLVP